MRPRLILTLALGALALAALLGTHRADKAEGIVVADGIIGSGY